MKDSVSNARNHALRLIRYRNRSEKELTDRLSQKGFSPGIVSETIELLKNNGLVDDASLARLLEDIARNVKHLGNLGTEFFLRKRGISEDIIAEMVISDSDEFERAAHFVEKKSGSLSHYPLKTQIVKIKGLLLRRGYAFETVNRVITAFKRKRDRLFQE